MSPSPAAPRFGLVRATLLVITSMIGTGVYTTSGYVLARVHDPLWVLVAWALAGTTAIFGALAYGWLGLSVDESGGEPVLVERFFHAPLGLFAGLVTSLLGFIAPIASCAYALERYAIAAWPALDGLPISWIAVIASAVFGFGGERLLVALDLLSGLKSLLALVFVVVLGAALALHGPAVSLAPTVPFLEVLPDLLRSVVMISFAYTGWNAAVYVRGELVDAERTLPRALVGGAGSVMLLYLALNLIFLLAVPSDALRDVLEVGHTASRALLGEGVARALSTMIALGLVSTLGAFSLSGARVLEALGRRHRRLGCLVHRPFAVGIETVLALVLLASARYDQLLEAVGFAVTAVSALTVFGLLRGHGVRGLSRAQLVVIGGYALLSLATLVVTTPRDPVVLLVGTGVLIATYVGCWVITNPSGSPPNEA